LRTMPWRTYGKLQHSDSESEAEDPRSPTPQRTALARHISLPLPALRKSSRVTTQPARLQQNAEKTGGPPETDDQFRRRVEGLPPCKARTKHVQFPSEVPGPSSAQSETESTLTKPSTPPKSLTGRLAQLIPATPTTVTRLIGSASDMACHVNKTLYKALATTPLPPSPIGEIPPLGPVPGDFPDLPTNPFGTKDIVQMCREGGVEMINWLLSAAEKNHPIAKPVREWTYCDVLKLPKDKRKMWLRKDGAYAKELEALREQNVFGPLVDLPPGTTAIGNRWVHDIKRDGRIKARFVCQGFSQKPSIDYDQVFSPVVRIETRHIMDALMALEGWHVEGLNVKSAYLYGKLDEEIYIQQPEGFVVKGQERKVIRLNRALYGLKQSGLVWWHTLVRELEKMGFKRIHADAALFVYREKGNRFVIALVYIDDTRLYGPLKAFVLEIKNCIKRTWECCDTEDDFLGTRTTRDRNKVYLDQREYLEKVIERCRQQDAKPCYTPLPASYVPLVNTDEVDPEL
jgi:hypothetical protein